MEPFGSTWPNAYKSFAVITSGGREPIGLLQDGVYRSDLNGTDALPVLIFTGRTHLTGFDLRGPVIIRCNDSLSLDADNSMEMGDHPSTIHHHRPGAMISAQCFASLGIAVGEGAELRFPSLLAVWRDDRRSDAARIILSENALVVGGVIAIDRSIRGRQEGSVSIASGSHIHGEVYAEGGVQMQGELYGTLTAREFTLRTPASVYRGTPVGWNHPRVWSGCALGLRHHQCIEYTHHPAMGKDRTPTTQRLVAATLMESVLALGLMATALSFAVGLHFRLLTSDHSADRLQAWALTEEVIAAREQPSSLVTPGTGSLSLAVSERPYALGLSELTISCTKGDRSILVRRCIVPAP
ncbi:MAG: hypothetical protein IPH05_03415 [Flavobacteriales bacterium]|nr:hypothetical protein [Flavobacteriales bacterium]